MLWEVRIMESRRRNFLLNLLILIAILVFPLGIFGQTSGTITGIVTDQSGASIPNAVISITNLGTGVVARTLKTGTDGIYVAEALPVGTYQITASAAGFQRAVSSRIVLNVADRVSVNFKLKVASSTQTVEVTAAIQQVETQTGELSHTVSTEQITQLPILDRNFMELQQVVPGATKDSGVGDEIGKGFYGERGYAVNGFDQHYTGYQLDGVQNTDMGNQASTMTNPGPDTLAEIKSGTKEFHGDAYDFVRNDALDANSFFLNKANVARPPFHYNDFGYTIGGPFYIPGHYNTDKSKTFFFWDQEWIRESTESPLVAATPTVAMRNGDFTGVGPLTNPTDPLTGQPLTAPGGGPCVTGSQINPACINNNVRLLFNQDFPTPNSPGFFNFITGARSGQNWGEQMIRVDQNVSEKIKAFVRFIHDSWLENDPTVQWSGDAFPTLHSQFNI